jgi:hypothetical protein
VRTIIAVLVAVLGLTGCVAATSTSTGSADTTICHNTGPGWVVFLQPYSTPQPGPAGGEPAYPTATPVPVTPLLHVLDIRDCDMGDPPVYLSTQYETLAGVWRKAPADAYCFNVRQADSCEP